MSQSARNWLMFIIRWGIAVAGIWWVISNMTWRDRITVLDDQNHPRELRLAVPAREDSASFLAINPAGGEALRIPRADTVNLPDRPRMRLKIKSGPCVQQVQLLALDLRADLRKVQRILVTDPQTGRGMWVLPTAVVDPRDGYQLRVPHPRVEVGLGTMLRLADPALLAAAVAIFPLTFLLTSLRWNFLLRAIGIRLSQARTFILNMVGFFYSTFMPGSTGGDVLKAYYASRQTPHRTQAVLSVLIDRVIGLLALIVLGGAMAAFQYFTSSNGDDPAIHACRRVAAGSGIILAATLAAVLFFAISPLRRALGVDFIISRLPMQKHVQHAVQVMRTYRDKPLIVLWALLITLPVHITVVIAAIFSGNAFGLPLPVAYYFVAVPVIVLSGALPISPQGAGVMEFFAIQLTKQYGVTVSQAFALTMSIRLVQILWNLTGGVFVLRGGYHKPTRQEQAELEAEEAAQSAGSDPDDLKSPLPNLKNPLATPGPSAH